SSAQVSLVSDGKTLGMFPNFKLNVETVNVKVKGAEDDNEVSLAVEGFDKPLEEVEEDENIYGPLIPGEYNVEATVQNELGEDRKSTRLNSSHVSISYAVFCLKKKIDEIARTSMR